MHPETNLSVQSAFMFMKGASCMLNKHTMKLMQEVRLTTSGDGNETTESKVVVVRLDLVREVRSWWVQTCSYNAGYNCSL